MRSTPSMCASAPSESEPPPSMRMPKVLRGLLSPMVPPSKTKEPPESTCTTAPSDTFELLLAMMPPAMRTVPLVHTIDWE